MCTEFAPNDNCPLGQQWTMFGCVPCAMPSNNEKGKVNSQDLLNSAPGIIDSIGGFWRNITGKGGPTEVHYHTEVPKEQDGTTGNVKTVLIVVGGGLVAFVLYLIFRPKK